MGNMWAQSWEEIYDLVIPYPGKSSVDVTDAMKSQVSSLISKSFTFWKNLKLVKLMIFDLS